MLLDQLVHDWGFFGYVVPFWAFAPTKAHFNVHDTIIARLPQSMKPNGCRARKRRKPDDYELLFASIKTDSNPSCCHMLSVRELCFHVCNEFKMSARVLKTQSHDFM